MIQGLLDLGFEIRSPQPKLAPDSQDFVPLLRELEGKDAIPLARLRAIWNQCRLSPTCPAEIHLCLGERMLKQGEAILAYDVLSQALAAGEQRQGVSAPGKFLQVADCAVAGAGASSKWCCGACQRHPSQDPPTGLRDAGNAWFAGTGQQRPGRPRAFPNGAAQVAGAIVPELLFRFSKADAALRLQGEDGDAGDVSTAGLMRRRWRCCKTVPPKRAGSPSASRTFARERLLRSSAAGDKADYWLTATLAEAELISGNYAEAEATYRAAAPLVEGNWRELVLDPPAGAVAGAAIGFGFGIRGAAFPRDVHCRVCRPRLGGSGLRSGDVGLGKAPNREFQIRLGSGGRCLRVCHRVIAGRPAVHRDDAGQATGDQRHSPLPAAGLPADFPPGPRLGGAALTRCFPGCMG